MLLVKKILCIQFMSKAEHFGLKYRTLYLSYLNFILLDLAHYPSLFQYLGSISVI